MFFPVLALPVGAQVARTLGGTPTTIVVNRENIIERVWVGPYYESARSEIEAYFRIELPVLTRTQGPHDPSSVVRAIPVQ